MRNAFVVGSFVGGVLLLLLAILWVLGAFRPPLRCNLFLRDPGAASIWPGVPGRANFPLRLFYLEDGTVIQYGPQDQVVCKP